MMAGEEGERGKGRTGCQPRNLSRTGCGRSDETSCERTRVDAYLLWSACNVKGDWLELGSQYMLCTVLTIYFAARGRPHNSLCSHPRMRARVLTMTPCEDLDRSPRGLCDCSINSEKAMSLEPHYCPRSTSRCGLKKRADGHEAEGEAVPRWARPNPNTTMSSAHSTGGTCLEPDGRNF